MAPVPLLGIRRGGGPLKRRGVYNIPGPGLQADLTLKKISIEDQCDPHIYYKFAWKKDPKNQIDSRVLNVLAARIAICITIEFMMSGFVDIAV